jgi:hypothetical protein
MGVFGGDYISILTNYHFQVEDDKICEVGNFVNFI